MRHFAVVGLAITVLQAATSSAQDLAALPWRSIGPSSFGGRIDDIEAFPRQSTTIFVGTAGGGIFRYMYSRFLNEAAVITGDMRLAKYGADLRTAADRWQEAAHVFIDAAELPDPSAALEDVSIRLLKIADREEDVWCALNRIISDLPRIVR